FGVGGLFDAARAQGLTVYDEDFGQTLGHYGVGPGPHIVMPFLGPTNLRDLPSKLVDWSASPLSTTNQFGYELVDNVEQMMYIQGGRTINEYSYKVDDYNLSKQYGDQYIFIRDMYENKRQRMVNE
ncbi:MAG: MlaA family lipoprotein, partial [Campylobacterota bacterium]